jgi:predicted alternative tryptophan synthase beta-subunit
MAPHICALYEHGDIQAVAVGQVETFEAAVQFARAEGFLPAPESAHAVRAAIDEAMAAREAGQSRTIAFNLSGHGYLDLAAYDAFLKGELENFEYPQGLVQQAMARLPEIPVPAGGD